MPSGTDCKREMSPVMHPPYSLKLLSKLRVRDRRLQKRKIIRCQTFPLDFYSQYPTYLHFWCSQNSPNPRNKSNSRTRFNCFPSLGLCFHICKTKGLKRWAQVLFLATVRVYDSSDISPHLHVISMALILCLNSTEISLNPAPLLPLTRVSGSLVLSSYLHPSRTSKLCPHLPFTVLQHSLGQAQLHKTQGTKKIALPNIPGCNMGAQGKFESTGEVPSFWRSWQLGGNQLPLLLLHLAILHARTQSGQWLMGLGSW